MRIGLMKGVRHVVNKAMLIVKRMSCEGQDCQLVGVIGPVRVLVLLRASM